MDYQNRVGSKKGSGGIAGSAETNQYRRERLKNLLQAKINIDSDPYVFKNHLGILECKLCLTTHMSESSYITHTTGRRHQLNLMRRAENEKKNQKLHQNKTEVEAIEKRYWSKIGNPTYRVSKIRDPVTLNKGLLFIFKLDKIKSGITPQYKLMSCYEQKKEPVDVNYRYLILSAEPYQNVCFKIPGSAIDMSPKRLWDYWDPDTKEYCIQLFYLNKGN